jgi:hypothetical protein
MATKNRINPTKLKIARGRLMPTLETFENGYAYRPVFKSAGIDPITINNAAEKPNSLFEDMANADFTFDFHYDGLRDKVLQKKQVVVPDVQKLLGFNSSTSSGDEHG